MKNLISFFVIILIFYSCAENNNIVVNEVSIKAQVVKIDSANTFMWPKMLIGDVLYAYSGDYYVSTLTKNEWKKAEDVFKIGHGHNEFNNMVISKSEKGELLILNRPTIGEKLLSLVKVPDADSIAAIKDESKWKKIDLKQLPAFWNMGDNFCVMNDSSIIIPGAPAEDMAHALSVIDYKNFKITPLDYWPDDASKPDDWQKCRRYAEKTTIFGDFKGNYLYTNGWGPLAFIFRVEGQKVNIESALSPCTFTKTTPTKRLSSCVDSERIYMLIRDSNEKGVKFEEYDMDDPYFFGNTIEVYDWSGVKQHVIHLDQYGQNILLSEDGKTLFLLPLMSNNIQDPIIYSYDLSAIK